MSTHLEDQIWQELERAALRDAGHGWVMRTRRAIRAAIPRPPSALRVAATMAVLAATAVTIVVLGRPAPPPDTPARADIQVTQIARGLGSLTTGFGAWWTYDTAAGKVLRVDPETHAVSARVPVRGPWTDAAVAAGAGAVWAVPVLDAHNAPDALGRPVDIVQIDPRTNAVLARIPARMPDGEPIVPLGVAVRGETVWVWGQDGAVRIDPASGRIAGEIVVRDDHIKGFYAGDSDVWVATENGALLQLDPRTGTRRHTVSGPVITHSFPLAVLPGVIVVGDQTGTTSAVDPATGETVWQAQIPGGIRDWTTSDGRLWVLTSDESGPNDQLLSLDPASGRTTARIPLPSAGGRGLRASDGALLVTTQDGELAIVR